MDRRIASLCLGLASLVAQAETLRVPLDYSNPKLGSGEIYYELGAPFDRHKPILFVIADGQQFRIRKGRMKTVQEEYGPAFNVLGIVGRAAAPDMVRAVTSKDGSIDWTKAWRYYRAEQWVEDIERVRQVVAGPKGKILLYGASGGAMMAHQYLARYGRFVSRCLTPAAAMPFIEGELRLSAPKLWPQLSRELRDDVQKILRDHQADRQIVATVFQRQHFFVTAEQLASEREKLIRAVAAGDIEQLKKARTEYQVDAVMDFLHTSAAIPIRVREYEFLAAAGHLAPPPSAEFDPDFESEYDDALPLIELRKQGKIGLPRFDFQRLHILDAQVLILAGFFDEAVDYRSSISLAARYPGGRVLILNDNHVLAGLSNAKLRGPIEQAFLLHGFGSRQYDAAVASLGKLIWREN